MPALAKTFFLGLSLLWLCPAQAQPSSDLQALLDTAQEQQERAQPSRAQTSLQRLISLAREQDDSYYQSAGLARLGRLQRQQQRPGAGQTLAQALQLARRGKHLLLQVEVINEMANLQAGQGHIEAALDGYVEAHRLAIAAGNLDLQLVATLNQSRMLALLDRIAEAQRKLRQSAAELESIADPRRRNFLRTSLGHTAAMLVLRHPPDAPASLRQLARGQLQKSIVTARSLGEPRIESLALGALAALLDEQSPEQSIKLRQRAIFLSRQAGADDLLFRQLWDRGRRQHAGDQLNAAIQSYRAALDALQKVRPYLDQGHFDAGNSLQRPYHQLYYELASLLLEIPNSLETETRRRQRLQEARNAVELLKAVELQDYFQDNCVTALRERTAGIDSLDPGTAVLYLIPLEDRIELLISTTGQMDQITVPVPRRQFEDEISKLRHLLEKRTTHQYLRHARKLYNWLLRPVESRLAEAGITTLVTVPQGRMASVPMAALHDGKQFLIQRYALATTPGLALTDPGALQPAQASALVAGLSDPVQGFPGLPNVPAEMDAILKSFDGTRLDNQAFSDSNLSAALHNRPYPIVHIASHAQFRGESDATFLLAYSDRIDLDRLQELLNISEFRKLPVELLTLSACQTAAGDDEAALGLAGIAVKSGARSALATLWSVPDASTSLLMDTFYRQLAQPGTSRARALQTAQLRILKDRRYRHPAYWAPFLMIGNWL